MRGVAIDRVRRWHDSPWTVRRQEWTVTRPADRVAAAIAGGQGKPTERDATTQRWSRRVGWIYQYRLTLDLATGTITEEVSLATRYRMLVTVLVGASIVALSPIVGGLGASFGTRIAGVQLLLFTGIGVLPDDIFGLVDLEPHAIRTAWWSTSFLGVTHALFFLGIWGTPLGLSVWEQRFRGLLCLFGVVSAGFLVVIHEAVPGVTFGSGVALLMIPATGTTLIVIALGWPAIYAVVPGSLVVRYGPGVVPLLLGILPASFLVTGGTLVGLLVYFFRDSRTTLTLLRTTRLSAFQHDWLRYLVLSVYLGLNAAGVLATGFVVTVIGYGVTGQFLLPPGVTSVAPSLATGLPQAVQQSYAVLDSFFASAGVAHPRTWSTGLITLASSFQVLFVVLWVAHIGQHIVSTCCLAIHGDRQSYTLPSVETTVELLVLPAPGENTSASSLPCNRLTQPLVRPVSVGVGLWERIVIRQDVLDTLPPAALDAVVLHEYYHLQNRDLQVNALATVLTILAGGRNALLAFYDYPAVERAADQFAARHVGTDAVITAIRLMEQYAMAASTPRVTSGSPGFTEPTDPDYAETTTGRMTFTKAVRRVRRGLVVSLTAPYMLYFGRVLFDTARPTPDERIATLAE